MKTVGRYQWDDMTVGTRRELEFQIQEHLLDYLKRIRLDRAVDVHTKESYIIDVKVTLLYE